MDYNGNSDKIQKSKGEVKPSKSDLQAKHDTLVEEPTSQQKYSLKDEGLGESHIYSLDEDENTESHLPDVPATAFKRSKRRTRKDFTSEEIDYLLDGVQKRGHHWNTILWAYPFQKGRTNVDLAKKYFKLQAISAFRHAFNNATMSPDFMKKNDSFISILITPDLISLSEFFQRFNADKKHRG
ncbi:UNVERIFIED_CONTAM: hypothetical protein K2H54_036579 [Gekko kuhli]